MNYDVLSTWTGGRDVVAPPHGKAVCMTLFQKLSPTGGDKSAAQNYGRADQLRGLKAFAMLTAGVGLVPPSFVYPSSIAFIEAYSRHPSKVL